MSRDVARCTACQGSGEETSGDYCWTCNGTGELERCTTCRDAITGSIWQGGVCLPCHEDSLLPETALDRWEAEFAL